MLASTVVSVLQTIKELFSLDSHLLLNPGYLVLLPGVSLHFRIYWGQWQSTLSTGTLAVPSSSYSKPFFSLISVPIITLPKEFVSGLRLKRHPGVLGRTKVNMSLKNISNIIILQTLSERKWWKQYHVIATGDWEHIGFFYCLCTAVRTNSEKIPLGTAVRIRGRWKIHSKFTENSCIDTVMVSGVYHPASLWFWQNWLPEASGWRDLLQTIQLSGPSGWIR